MSTLGHLGALLIRVFGLALAAGAVTVGYFLGMPYLDNTLEMFNEGRYGAVIGIAVATGLPTMFGLYIFVASPWAGEWDWRLPIGALLFIAGSGFLLWFSYHAVTTVEGSLIFGESPASGIRRCNWVCWLSRTEWGKWVAVPFLGFIWWIVGNLAVLMGAAGCAWLIASTQRELASVYSYINRIIQK